jgi:hypothetical protein
MLMSRDQNAEQNHSMKIDNRPFKREEEFKNKILFRKKLRAD